MRPAHSESYKARANDFVAATDLAAKDGIVELTRYMYRRSMLTLEIASSIVLNPKRDR